MSSKRFDRSIYSQYTSSQLLDTLEQEYEKANIYEARFRDVVRAYKGIMKEKEALEASLKALSVSHDQSHNDSSTAAAAVPLSSEGEEDSGNSSSSKIEQDGGADEMMSLRQQVTTLAQALNTLTIEKSKMESSFQQDKRGLLSHQETLSQQLIAERERGEEDRVSVQRQLEMVQHSLKLEQRAREEEQRHHGDMLRELQALISSERASKQSLTDKLKETETKMTELENFVARSQEQQQQLSDQLAGQHHSSAAVKKLQQDLLRMKEEHELSLAIEHQQVNEADRRLQQQAQHEEARVANLETKLSELSDMLGSYDRQRETDTVQIQKLKERILQLDKENTALTTAHVNRNEPLSDEEAITALHEKITKLKALLRVATLKIIERPSPHIDDMTVSEYSDLLSSEPSKKDYQLELSQLRDEFDSYKKKAQSVLRSKNTQQAETGSQDATRRELERALLRVDELQSTMDEEREKSSLQTQQLREELRRVHDQHNHKVLQLDLQYKQKLTDLQVSIQTARERTKKIMEEKDSEIVLLREGLCSQRKPSDSAPLPDIVRKASRQDSSSEAIQELLDQSGPANQYGEVKLFLHAQEQHRVSQELALLRHKRLELEDTVRDLTEREQKYSEQNQLLKSEIRKLERDRSRETENMEYLKNVIMHFMCSDSVGREQLVTPLSTVLHFTPTEIQTVRRRMAARHWLSSPSNSSNH